MLTASPVVTANVTRIGCGIAYCPFLDNLNYTNMLFVVCRYWCAFSTSLMHV